MRIGFMADAYKPHLSGVTNYIHINKLALEKLGHDVFVFAFGDPQQPHEEENVIISPGLAVKGAYHIGLRYTRRAIELIQSMDVVHLHHPFLSGRLALRYCKPRGIPLVFTNHTRYDLYFRYYAPFLPAGLGLFYLKRYLPGFCRRMDLVISPSEGLRKVSRTWGVDAPIEVIPNGIDLQPFMNPQTRITRAELGLQDDQVVLLYVGRVVAEKNLGFVFKAFAAVSKYHSHARLMIIGDGDDRPRLERLAGLLEIQEKVLFTGMIPYQDLPAYIHLGDAFVTASTTEVHPFTIIEANACGLPVLGIDSPGVSDTIRDGENGYIVSNSFDLYVDRMTELITNHKQRTMMGRKALEMVGQYSIEKTAGQVLKHYIRLVNERQRKK